MTGDFQVTSGDLKALGRRMKAEGDGTLRKDVLRGIRTSAKKVIPNIRQGALDRLPRSGGLADEVAGQKFTTRTSLAAGKVSIVGLAGMKSLEDIDRGRLRHPVFGDRDRWVGQGVTAGFFTGPIETKEPEIKSDIQGVLNAAARRLGRPL